MGVYFKNTISTDVTQKSVIVAKLEFCILMKYVERENVFDGASLDL